MHKGKYPIILANKYCIKMMFAYFSNRYYTKFYSNS